jgi:hypothetical protein
MQPATSVVIANSEMYQDSAVQPGWQHSLPGQGQQQQRLLGSHALLGLCLPDSPVGMEQLDAIGEMSCSSLDLQLNLLQNRQLPASCHPDVVAALEHLADVLTGEWQDPLPADDEIRLALEYQLHRAGSLPEVPQVEQEWQLQRQLSTCNSHATPEDAHSAATAQHEHVFKFCGQQTQHLNKQQPPGPWQLQQQQQQQRQQQQQQRQQPGRSEGAPVPWAASLLQRADAACSAEEVFACLNQLLEAEINCCAAAGDGSRTCSPNRDNAVAHQQAVQQGMLWHVGCSGRAADTATVMPGSSDRQRDWIASTAAAGTMQATAATAAGMLLQQQTCAQQRRTEPALAAAAAAAAALPAWCASARVAGLGSIPADQQQQQQQQQLLMAAMLVAVLELDSEPCTVGSLRPHVTELNGFEHGTDALQQALTDAKLQRLHKRKWQPTALQQPRASHMQLQSRTVASQRGQAALAAVKLHRANSDASSRSGSVSQPQQRRRAATFDLGPQQRRIQQEMLRREQRREQRRRHQHQLKRLHAND